MGAGIDLWGHVLDHNALAAIAWFHVPLILMQPATLPRVGEARIKRAAHERH